MNSGTGAENVIPGTLEVKFNFRFSTESTQESLQSRVENILNKHGLNFEIDWHLSGAPFLTGTGELLKCTRKAIEETLGVETIASTGGGTSDGRFIAPTGAEVIELGPINETIHQIDEHTNVDQLSQLKDIYKRVLKNLLTP